jgi:hypothetical protein
LDEVGRDLGVLLDGRQAVIVSRLCRHGQCPVSGGFKAISPISGTLSEAGEATKVPGSLRLSVPLRAMKPNIFAKRWGRGPRPSEGYQYAPSVILPMRASGVTVRPWLSRMAEPAPGLKAERRPCRLLGDAASVSAPAPHR